MTSRTSVMSMLRVGDANEKPLPAPPISEYSFAAEPEPHVPDYKQPVPKSTQGPHWEAHPRQDVSKAFKSRLQLGKMLFETFLKWFIGIVLLLFIFATLKIYQNKGNCSDSNKQWFNAIITGLNIALAINFFSALADLAKILRWRALAQNPHSLRDVDLILSADSLSKLTALAFRYSKKAFTQVFARRSARPREVDTSRSAWSYLASSTAISFWLLLNLIAQAVIALIGLTYSFDAGPLLYPPPIGPTFQSDIQNVYQLWSSTPLSKNSSAEESIHQLGDIGTIFNAHPIFKRDEPDTFVSSEQYYFFPRKGFPVDSFTAAAWLYRYFNYDSPDFYNYTYSVPTKKTILTWYDNCQRYPVVSGAGERQSNAKIIYRLPDGTTSTLIIDIVGRNATTYIWPGRYTFCINKDPRCAVMQAFTEPYKGAAASVYSCEVYVGHVTNDDGTRHSEDVPDNIAHLAAGAAGLTGFGSTQSFYKATGKSTQQQFVRYPSDSWWSLSGKRSVDYVGSTMAQFAIAALASMAEFNPKSKTIGESAKLGVVLNVEWKPLAILLPLIGVAHLVLFSVAVFLANPYVVRDDSNLANAQLFAPMLRKAGLGITGTGSYLTGKEIAKLCDAAIGHSKVMYRAEEKELTEDGQLDPNTDERERKGSTFWLGLAQHNPELKRKHSDGIYL